MAYIQDNIAGQINRHMMANFRETLDSFEQAVAGPIRVLGPMQGQQGRSLSFCSSPWRAGSQPTSPTHHPNWTAEDIAERGFTILFGDFVREFGRNVDVDTVYVEDEWYTQSNRDLENRYLYDVPDLRGRQNDAWRDYVREHGEPAMRLSTGYGGAGEVATMMLVDRTLFISFPLNGIYQYARRDRADNDNGTFTYHMNWEYAQQFVIEAMDPEARERAAEARRERDRLWFHEALRDRGNVVIRTLRHEIEDSTLRLIEAQRTVSEETTTLTQRQQYLDTLLDQGEDEITQERADGELQAILDHAKVERIEVRNINTTDPATGQRTRTQCLDVWTVPLDITVPSSGETVYLGKFKITFDFGRSRVTVHNLDNAQDDGRGNGRIDHPHVRNGDLCAAEYASTITTLLRRREPASAVNMLIHILGQVTERDDWGRSIHYFVDAHYGRENATNE